MTDPLVINFDSPLARLGDTKFEFDLDSDGEADQLATLGGKRSTNPILTA